MQTHLRVITSYSIHYTKLYEVRRQATEGAAERLRCFIIHVFHIANEGKLVLSQGMKNNPLFFNAHNNEFFETIEEIRHFLSDCFKELNP